MTTDETTARGTAQLPTRAERLDRLRFAPEHAKLLVGSGVGWALDAMDVGLISYVMTALAAQWGLSNSRLSWIGSIGFVGMMIGASVGGLLADRLGRRTVFALTLLVYGVATGAAALSVGVGMLIVLRLVVGIGLGAELPVASTLVSEFAPRRIRGRMVVWLESFWALGWILAALLGRFLVPRTLGGVPGWRWALLVGIVPAVYALVVRHGLPESVRFLESTGRLDRAEASVRVFERSAGVEPRVDAATAVECTPLSASARGRGARSLFAPAHRRSTVALWLVWFFVNLSYYGAFTWMPTLLLRQGHSLVHSMGYTLVMTLAQIPGYAASAWLVERWGRRPTLVVLLLASGVAAVVFGLQSGPVGIMVAGSALSFFNLGAWGALYAIGPEIYPTALRGAGTGAASAVGRVAGIVAPLVVPLLLRGGHALVFVVFAISFVIAGASALLLPERRSLDMVE